MDNLAKYKELYETNSEFRNYVSRLRRSGKNLADKTVEEVLMIKTVETVGDYYSTKIPEQKSPFSPNMDHGIDDCDCKGC